MDTGRRGGAVDRLRAARLDRHLRLDRAGGRRPRPVRVLPAAGRLARPGAAVRVVPGMRRVLAGGPAALPGLGTAAGRAVAGPPAPPRGRRGIGGPPPPRPPSPHTAPLSPPPRR